MSYSCNFDANACYGVSAYVAEGLARVGFDMLNPNSVHRGGQRSRALIEQARERIGRLIGLDSDSRIVFTSGATEANNTALRIPFQYSSSAQLIVSSVEHPSVRETALMLGKKKVPVHEIPGSPNSKEFAFHLAASICADTNLISLICVNNETGEISPLRKLIEIARSNNPHLLIHSDGVQALGKIPVNFEESGLDLLTLSGHKIGALSGIGALIVGARVPYEPLLYGGVQELHHRAGTENVLGIVSFGLAAEEVHAQFEARAKNMKERRAQLLAAVSSAVPDLLINSPLDGSVCNTLNVRVPGVRSDDLVVALDQAGFLVSSGAACASGKPEPSPVLKALGLNEVQARESLRISMRADATAADVDGFAMALAQSVQWMRSSQLRAAGEGR